MNRVLKFELTEEHLTLMKNMNIGWGDGYDGAPEINCKRPYGNSGDVAYDIFRLLNVEPDYVDRDGDNHWDEEQFQWAHQLHRETEIALQIVLTTQSFKPGVYQRESVYSSDKWELVDE